MRRGTGYVVVAAALMACGAASAEELSLKVSGSVRARYEAIAENPRPGAPRDDDLFNLRSILHAEAQRGRLTVVGEMWDSRAYGAAPRTPLTTGEVDAFELMQAYVAWDAGSVLGAGSKTRLQAGRMLLDLGSRRLVAADDYRNTTNGFTGVRLDTARGGAQATLVWVLPEVRLPDDAQGLRDNRVAFDRESLDLQLFGALASAPVFAGARAELSYLALRERDAPDRVTRDRRLDSLDVRVWRPPAPRGWDAELELIAQTGSIAADLSPGARRVPVRAGAVHASLGYRFARPWRPRLAAEVDAATGDRARSADRYERFDPYFGMRRGDLAPAGLYNLLGRTNLVAPGLRVEVEPSTRVDAFVTYKPLWLASRSDVFSTAGARDPSGRSGPFAGHQVDARLRWWLRPQRLRLELDGVWLTRGRFLQDAPSAAGRGDTLYGSANLTASF